MKDTQNFYLAMKRNFYCSQVTLTNLLKCLKIGLKKASCLATAHPANVAGSKILSQHIDPVARGHVLKISEDL